MSKDIEDIFSNAFGEFEQTPSERVWKGIAQDREEKQRLGITEATPESEMTHGLSNLAAEPGEGVWQAIAHNRFMKLMQRRMLRVAAAILLLLGIGLAANSLVEREEGSGKRGEGSSRQPAGGSQEASVGRGQSKENKKQSEVVSQQSTNGSQLPITIGTAVGSEQSTDNSQQSAAKGQQPTDNGQQSAEENQQSTADGGQSTVDGEEPSDKHSIAIATKSPAALPAAVPDMSKLPKPKRMNSPHKDHFFYTPTVASGKKYGNNYIKYNRETDLNNEGSRLKLGVAFGGELNKFKTTGDSTYYQRMRAVGYEGIVKSISGSFSANLRVYKDIYLQTGVNFVRRSASPHYDATFGHQVMTIGASGDTTYAMVTDYAINAKAKYHLTHLEFPILIGYTFGEKRMSFHGHAGPSYNMLVGKGGNMLSAVNMQVMALSDANAHQFTKSAWGWIGNLGASVQIKHELSLTGDLTYKYYANMFAGDYPATQTMHSLGVNVGIRYHVY